MMTMAALLLSLWLAQSAAQPPAAAASQPPCAAPDNRTLDFWVGDWVAHDSAGQRVGTNKITRDEYGSCVITEHFRLGDGSMIGHSVSIYRPAQKQWRQTWVDSQGSYFDLVGGPVTGSDHIFVFENKRVSDSQPHQRMIFQDVKPDSFTWRWQKRAKAEEAWADSWVLNYRKSSAGSSASAK